MSYGALVIDANILVRAVLGNKVRQYLIEYSDSVDFFVTDTCIEEAQKYLPLIFEKRGIRSDVPLHLFDEIKRLLQIIDKAIYQEREVEAKQRMKSRDIFDWPAVATALLFNCAIWTEDKDFFGAGIPTWTTDRIQLFFNTTLATIKDYESVIS